MNGESSITTRQLTLIDIQETTAYADDPREAYPPRQRRARTVSDGRPGGCRPMMGGKLAARACTHPVYPDYRDTFGEDPARFLHHHLDPTPRIQAIRDRGLVRAYLDVETDRDEPRREVVAACNQRLDTLTTDSGGAAARAVATDGGDASER
jgi:hypothetical protein